MLRTIGIVAGLQLLALASAYACDAQPGKVIFEDSFADDSGGWQQTPPQATIRPPAFVFAVDAKYVSMSSHNLTFHATEGDFCVEAALPRAVAADDIPIFGIEFWATDYRNYMLLQLSAKGEVALWNRTGEQWREIFTVANAAGFKSEPEAINALRFNAMGGKITSYLNGKQVKVTRAQFPTGNMKFGIYSGWDKKAAHPAIKVTSFKVTTGR